MEILVLLIKGVLESLEVEERTLTCVIAELFCLNIDLRFVRKVSACP